MWYYVGGHASSSGANIVGVTTEVMLVHMMSMVMPQAVAKMVVSAVTIEVSWCGVGGLYFKTWRDGGVRGDLLKY